MQICSEHSDFGGTVLRWICETCNGRRLCLTCIMKGKHKTHKYVEACKKLIERSEKMESLISELDQFEFQINLDLTREKENYEVLSKRSSIFVKEMADLIESAFSPALKAQKEIISKLENLYSKCMPRIKEMREKLNNNIKPIQEKIKNDEYTYDSIEAKIIKKEIEFSEIKQKSKDILRFQLPISELLELQEFTETINLQVNKYKQIYIEHLKSKISLGISCFYDSDDFKRIFIYDYKANCCANFDRVQCCGSAIWINSLLFTYGNNSFGKTTFSNSKAQTTRKADPIVGKECVALAAVDNSYIYCLGGKVDGIAQKSCEKYVIEQDKWYKICPTNKERQNHTSVAMDRYIYCFCGLKDQNNTSSSYEVLDTCEEDAGWNLKFILHEKPFNGLDVWLAPLAIGISSTSIIVFGEDPNEEYYSSAFVINLANNGKITKKKNIISHNEKRLMCKAKLYNGIIYTGYVNTSNKLIVRKYNIISNIWTTEANKP